MFRQRFNLKLIIGALVVLAVVTSIALFARPQAAGDLRVYFLDVGQGDASYIKTPGGGDILIDGGPGNEVLNQLGKVMDLGDREISLVILTHPHADHLSGLSEVIRRYQVEEVWETKVDYSSATYENWQQEISQKNITSYSPKEGDSKNFSEVKITVLYPLSSLENTKIDNPNNASIVNRLDFKKFSVLFTGDAEIEVQKKLIDKDIFATVLKVAHHGSKNGLSEDFLKAVRPAIAVISAGKDNKYGHPAASTINFLKQYAVRIFRTDQDKTIEISSDGEGYTVIKGL
ncbi:MAG: MBL fold metallo-hydrolase [Patescibacteria group bacterium]